MSDLNIYADQTAIDALTPITGDVVLRASDNAVLLYNGSAWKEFQPDAGPFSNQYSLSLDGSNDYVEIPAASELSFTDGSGNDSAFSVSAWAYIDSLSNFTLLTKGVYSTTGEYHIRMTGGQKMQLVLYRGTAYEACFIDQSLSIGQWYHFAFTYDGRGGTSANAGILGYLNGSLSPLSRASGGSYSGMISSSAPLYIGIHSSNYSNGKIDEVALFNYALSAPEVAALSDTTGSNPVPANISSLSPVGWWRMGDGSDGSGNNDGTVVGGLPQVYNAAKDGSGNRITGIDGSLTNGPTFSTDVPS